MNLIVFNKIDLIDKSKLNEKKNKFSKKIKKKVLTISTFDKALDLQKLNQN